MLVGSVLVLFATVTIAPAKANVVASVHMQSPIHHDFMIEKSPPKPSPIDIHIPADIGDTNELADIGDANEFSGDDKVPQLHDRHESTQIEPQTNGTSKSTSKSTTKTPTHDDHTIGDSNNSAPIRNSSSPSFTIPLQLHKIPIEYNYDPSYVTNYNDEDGEYSLDRIIIGVMLGVAAVLTISLSVAIIHIRRKSKIDLQDILFDNAMDEDDIDLLVTLGEHDGIDELVKPQNRQTNQ